MLKYSELKPYEQCAVRIGTAIIGVKDIKTAILEEIKADKLCARCWRRADKCECNKQEWDKYGEYILAWAYLPKGVNHE